MISKRDPIERLVWAVGIVFTICFVTDILFSFVVDWPIDWWQAKAAGISFLALFMYKESSNAAR